MQYEEQLLQKQKELSSLRREAERQHEEDEYKLNDALNQCAQVTQLKRLAEQSLEETRRQLSELELEALTSAPYRVKCEVLQAKLVESA